jgi:hypothetical protein
MSLIGTSLLLLSLLPAQGAPKAKLPLGKETTYVSGPLDKEGYIDYEAALNDRLGKGIKPDNNANVLLWKALGPKPEGGKGMPPGFFKRLGIKEPPANGAYFIGLHAYGREHLGLDATEQSTFEDQRSRASQRPWTAKAYPHVADWLKANEKPLSVVIEATKRPDYFNPLVSRWSEKEPSWLIGALLPGVQKCRELATALLARAMLKVAEGKGDDVWQDLLACHRLARLVSRGATLIELLVGIAIDQIATNADLAYLERSKLTSKQILDRLKDLRALPPLAPVADKIALGERLFYLDSVQHIRRGGIGIMENLSGGKTEKPTKEELEGLGKIDWEPALRDGNRWYNRMVAAMRLKDRASRKQALDKIEKDIKEMKARSTEPEQLAKLLMAKNMPAGKVEKEVSTAVGKAIGNVAITLLMPAIWKVQDAHDRGMQVQRNLHVAFALAAYQRDNDRYPAKLDDLAPKYLATVPDDLFSGKPLIYRPSPTGYLFYSVGANGKDEGGRWYDDNPPGDDPSVRMPLPELKKKK